MLIQHKKYLILIYLIFLFLLLYCTLEILAANSLTPEEVIKADILAQNNHDLSTYLSLPTTKVDSPENRNEIMILREKHPEYDILQKTVNYNRQAAYDYANYYWDEVCNDGYYMALDVNGSTFAVPFLLGTSYIDIQYFFDHNTTYGQLYGADCAHFVSSCIGDNGGGGLPVPHDYSYAVYGYVSATGLADWILNNNYGLQKYSINDLGMSDVILYDVSGGGRHIVLYLGDGLIAAHSYCLWGKTGIPLYGKSWIQPGLTVNKLIHIQTPSNPPIITVSSPTAGTVWYIGDSYDITWTVSGDTSNIDYFLLGYSIDGGNNYDLVNGVNSTAPSTARTYSWTVPNTPSTQCKILIGAIDTNGISLAATESEGLFTIIQAIAPLSITTSSLPSGTQNQFYSASFSATGGTTPYTWNRSSGTFPSDLSLSSSGVLSGTPSDYGNFNFTIQVTDSGGRTDSKAFTLHIDQAITTRIIRLEGNLSFGDVQIGTTSQKTLTIYNDGNSTLNVNNIDYPTGFSGNWSSGPISTGNHNDITVTFSPTQPIIYSGTLTVNSDATSGTNTKLVSGTGLPSTSAPQVTTNNASNITSTSAQLNGNLDSTGGLNCLVWFEYGKSTSYGISTIKQSKSSVGPFNDTIISLDPNTTYHFRACASNTEGTDYGADKIFTTPMLGDFGSAGGGPPDGCVDFEDLMIFALAYGSTPSDANWNPVCDIAGPGGPIPDGVIDFEDLMVFAMHYGDTCAD